MTSTRDGHWLFQAEGGEIAFIDTFDEMSGQYAQTGFDDEAKRVRVGARGVLASRMLLDPAATNAPNKDIANDLLYIAGGRDGLWMMEADINEGYENRAWRVDDSGNINNNIQNSKRWCSDVAVMTVAGEEYLLALFSKKAQSRLRAYKLIDVRAIRNSTTELGNELTALKQVKLNVHPSPGMPPTAPSFGRSVALSMTVDQSGDVGAEVADVYVAMGHHGIVRVQFSGLSLSAQRTWGPVFGNGTPYASIGSSLIPANKDENLYMDLEYELIEVFNTTRVIERQEAPVFTDVAVYRDDPLDPAIYHLYATVDHLFWLVFDLKNQTFGPSMPIMHHEGKQISVFPGDPGEAKASVEIVEPVDMQGVGGAARSLAIVEHSGAHYLVVTAHMFSFLKDYLITTTEGINWDYSFGWGGGFALGAPTKTQTFWYEIQASYPNTFNYINHLELGGEGLHLPELQELANELKIFHSVVNEVLPNSIRRGVCLTKASLVVGGTSTSFTRNQANNLGRYTFNAASSLLDPHLVLTAKNDAGIPRDGFLAMGKPAGGSWKVKTHYAPAGGGLSDDRGADGIILGKGGQWLDPLLGADHQYLWTGGVTLSGQNPDAGRGRWLLLDLEVPADTLTTSPNRTKAVYFIPPLDTFGNLGRSAFQTATMSLDLDLYLDGQGGDPARHLFGAHPMSAEGLVAMDRGKILTLAGNVVNGFDVDLRATPDAEFDPVVLVTHPEFNKLDRADPTARNWWGGQGPGKTDHRSRIANWAPILVNVKDPEPPNEFVKWVLVAPCGFISANLDWDIYDPGATPSGKEEWKPDKNIWTQNYTSGLIQFWEMVPQGGNGPYVPDTIIHEQIDGNSPLLKIVGQPKGNFWKLESIRIGDKVFLIAADFGGRVAVYEISDMLGWSHDPDLTAPPSALIAEWQAPMSLFDDLTTPVFDIAVDYWNGTKAIIYVAAQRIGVRLLELDTSGPTPVLTEMIDHIQTSEFATGVHVRVNTDGTRNLVVSHYSGGIHVYE